MYPAFGFDFRFLRLFELLTVAGGAGGSAIASAAVPKNELWYVFAAYVETTDATLRDCEVELSDLGINHVVLQRGSVGNAVRAFAVERPFVILPGLALRSEVNAIGVADTLTMKAWFVRLSLPGPAGPPPQLTGIPGEPGTFGVADMPPVRP